jgi:hypothetical protein
VISGLNSFLRKTDKQKALIKGKASDFVRRKTLTVARFAAQRTPQYSGDLVANWHLAIGVGAQAPYLSKKGGYPMDAPVNSAGELTKNWRQSYAAMRVSAQKIRYNSRISLVNTSPTVFFLTNGIPSDVSDGRFRFRPVNWTNVPDSGTVLSDQLWNIRTVIYAKFKYLGPATRIY